MSLFTEWNLLLLQEYFSPDQKGRVVWLPTTKLELDAIGIHKGGAAGLIEAVRQGPEWFCGNGNIAEKVCELVRQRKAERKPNGYVDPSKLADIYTGFNAPTYLPYLALWVYAGTEEIPEGFYATVSELTRTYFSGEAREAMFEVWKDLECWSRVVARMRFGNFKVNVLGAHKYVGMAYAQAIVSERDQDKLRKLFAGCRLHSGQSLGEQQFEALLSYGHVSNFLSARLRSAMGDPLYKDLLKDVLGTYLELWDGSVPKQALKAPSGAEVKAGGERAIDQASIVLKLVGEAELCWQIGWRVPAIVTGENYCIRVGDGERNKARLERLGTHIHCIESVNQSHVRQMIDQSVNENIPLKLAYTSLDGSESEKDFFLMQGNIGAFVWDSPDPLLGEVLVERELPVSGAAYLLYSTEQYGSLEHLLRNEGVAHQYVDQYPGLPDHWRLVCIERTQDLSDEQRAQIMDEEVAVRAQARIRFVGGKEIRGAGRKYPFYDLPIVELEAPAGTVLQADGLVFDELHVDPQTVLQEVNLPSSNHVRRFELTLNAGGISVFKIKALLGNEELCTAALQVLHSGGIGVQGGAVFSVDKFGRPLRDGSGLLGASLGNKTTSDSAWLEKSSFNLRAGEMNAWQVNKGDACKLLESNLSSQFLDTLAMQSSITYGVAKKQIERLACNLGLENIEPTLLMFDLRSRAHLEIETDAKGHITRLCYIPPAIYSLPLKNDEGCQLYGVCGSLRLGQWSEILNGDDCGVLLEQSAAQQMLPVVRVACGNSLAIEALSQRANLKVLNCPPLQIFQWLGSVQEIKENLSWYSEQGFSPNDLKRFNSNVGMFPARLAQDMRVDPNRQYEFFKFEDPQVQGLRIYKLGRNLSEGFSTYSFIQDSRWGVWMAMNALAAYVSQPPFSIPDAYPWPIHYEANEGCLWVPARLEPPYTIARALSLCAGSGPLVVNANGNIESSAIRLLTKEGKFIGNISLVYSEMINGKWLCYRWVPRVVASHVAGLLGGALKEI